MKLRFLFITFLGITHLTTAQEDCFCKKDLDFYYKEIQKTISYKDQIKGHKKKKFDATYIALKKEIHCSESTLECFDILNKLSYLIDDEHARLRSIPGLLTRENFRDENFIKAYIKTNEFKAFETVSIDLDSLNNVLQNSPIEEIPGIYYKTFFKVGVYQPANTNYFNGVVLDSKLKAWSKGQLVFRLLPTQKGNYRYYHANFVTKRWMAISNEFYAHKRLMHINWKKDTTQTDFHLETPKEKFAHKKLQKGISYIKLGSFGTGSKNRKEASTYLKELEKSSWEQHVIVDLRNNAGGGNKVSKPFQKFIEKQFKQGTIYVLININTGSNAEITSQRMRKAKNVFIVGQPSAGILAYGSNYGNKITLPSGKYEYKFTDMDVSKNIAFEGKGIPVDIALNFEENWIDQVIKLIENK